MPVIPKPEGFKVFGGKTMVLFGGYDKEAMRRWQERVRAAEKDSAETSIESVRDDGDSVDYDTTDEASGSRVGGPSGGDKVAD